MRYLLIALCAWSFVGCASLTKSQKQADALTHVKKVAVVAYSVNYQSPESVLDRVKKKAGLGGNPGDINGGGTTDMDELYTDFVDQLHKETSWQVMTVTELSRKPAYLTLMKDFTTGLIVRGPVPDNTTVYRPNHILDAGAFFMMKDEQKAQLAKELGVDAVAVININSSLEEEGGIKKYIGMSEFRPKAQVTIQVLDGRSDKPIWSDSWAWGSGDKAVASTMRMVDNKELMDQVKLAVRYGYNDLFLRYKAE